MEAAIDCSLILVRPMTRILALVVVLATSGGSLQASDISEVALAIAEENSERLGLKRVKFRRCDLLSDVPAGAYDLVVSNPPYVGKDEPEKVQKIVRDWEPEVAVFGGATGLEIYGRLVPQALHALRPGGWLVMEIGYSIEQPIRDLLRGWTNVQIKPDLQGIPRVAIARKP